MDPDSDDTPDEIDTPEIDEIETIDVRDAADVFYGVDVDVGRDDEYAESELVPCALCDEMLTPDEARAPDVCRLATDFARSIVDEARVLHRPAAVDPDELRRLEQLSRRVLSQLEYDLGARIVAEGPAGSLWYRRADDSLDVTRHYGSAALGLHELGCHGPGPLTPMIVDDGSHTHSIMTADGRVAMIEPSVPPDPTRPSPVPGVRPTTPSPASVSEWLAEIRRVEELTDEVRRSTTVIDRLTAESQAAREARRTPRVTRDGLFSNILLAQLAVVSLVLLAIESIFVDSELLLGVSMGVSLTTALCAAWSVLRDQRLAVRPAREILEQPGPSPAVVEPSDETSEP